VTIEDMDNIIADFGHPEIPIRLDGATLIINNEEFYKSHISELKAFKKKSKMIARKEYILPSYYRLINYCNTVKILNYEKNYQKRI